MHGRRNAPLAVLIAALFFTGAATLFVAVAGRQRDRARFENAKQEAQDRITARLATYIALLEGGRAFFGGSERVTAHDFHRYVETVDLPHRYPGIQGLGFSRRLAPTETAAVLATRRAEGAPSFRLRPDTPRPELHAILYLEPDDERNRAALGYDMFTEPVRRTAMERARDTGMPAMSGRVTLVQEISGPVQPGFLIYAPVYRGGEVPAGIQARRAALEGFVYAPFRAGDLFARIFGSVREPRLALRIYDGAVPDSSMLLFDSHDPAEHRRSGAPHRLEPLEIAGHRWLVEYHARPVRDMFATGVLTGATLLIGLLASAALYGVARREAAARERAERSEAARSRFFAAMSHELRTPINAIIGYNDLVLAEIYGPLSEAQRNGLERGQRAARHLLELVNDVLDLSKIEAGKIDVLVEPVDMPALLDDMMTTVLPMAAARGCALDHEEAGCPVLVSTDPRRVRQILLNLLSNATKFGAGKPVAMRCAARPDGGVSVEVRDQGPGIAPADMPRVFEEFVQLGRSEGGTGLGLPISRRLAHLLGGDLEVESTPGRGSTFRLVLPPRPPATAARAGSALAEPA